MTFLCADRILWQIKEKYKHYSKYKASDLQPRAPLEWKLSKNFLKKDKFLNYKILSHWNNKIQDMEGGGGGSAVISFHKTENIKNI